jgi:carbamoyl-phosphate synthase large subunit
MNILLTCAGRRSHIVRAFKDALGRRGRVLACDSTGAAPALLEADQGFMVPAVDHADYFEVLGGVCRQHEVRLVISVHDLELPGLAQHARRFREWGTIVVISAPEVIATCQDKWASFLFLRANNIPTPDTYKSLADAQEALACGALRYPLVIKPRWGTGSIGVEWVANDHELHLAHEWARLQLKKTFVAKLGQLNGAEPDGSFVFQQALAGQEYGMDIVNDLDGRHVACLCRKKLVMRAGNTDRAVTISEPSLERIGELLGERLGHVGPLDCDLIVAEDNSVVIDMNPRFGGGYPFSHLAGANLPAALIAWANGEESDAAWLQSKPGVLSAKYDGMAIIDQEGTVHEPGAAHERGRSAPKRLPSSTAILPTRSST